MFNTFNQLKALNPNITTIMYLNSMFDFTMYQLAGKVNALEAAGTRVLLRDKHDELVILCNDGNYYCNVTNFDWTQQVHVKMACHLYVLFVIAYIVFSFFLRTCIDSLSCV